tara:strand:+ start:2444 stop:2548 length:105 start_codon:yes stop_codon:yes gene_type:complete
MIVFAVIFIGLVVILTSMYGIVGTTMAFLIVNIV